MTRSAIFACMMCFLAGGCLCALLFIAAKKPRRDVFAGWAAYLLIVFMLAYKIGGALIL
jgi:hypothetical protein